MNIFLEVMKYIFALLPTVVTGIQSVAGDVTSGATKKQMATDALTAAATGAASVLSGGNAQLAQVAAGAVMAGITATDAISTAVSAAKTSPVFKAATATGNAAVASLASSSKPEAAAVKPSASSVTSDKAAPTAVSD